MDSAPALLSVARVATELGYSREHAYRLIRQRALPATRLSSGRIVVPRLALDAWLAAREVEALFSLTSVAGPKDPD